MCIANQEAKRLVTTAEEFDHYIGISCIRFFNVMSSSSVNGGANKLYSTVQYRQTLTEANLAEMTSLPCARKGPCNSGEINPLTYSQTRAIGLASQNCFLYY